MFLPPGHEQSIICIMGKKVEQLHSAIVRKHIRNIPSILGESEVTGDINKNYHKQSTIRTHTANALLDQVGSLFIQIILIIPYVGVIGVGQQGNEWGISSCFVITEVL